MLTRDEEIELAIVERELTERQGELVRGSLIEFVIAAWDLVEPREQLILGEYLIALCDHLQALTDGKHPTGHLIINMPPRFAKSLIVSVLWPAWEWLKDPRRRYLSISHTLELSIRDANKMRRLVTTERYRSWMRPELRFSLREDQDVKSNFENTLGGGRLCGAPGVKITGKGADDLLVDDLHAVNDGEDEIKKAVEWWDTAASNRVNNKKTARRVIVGQRVAPYDITGHLAEQSPERWDMLVFPFLFEVDRPNKPTMLGFIDWRTREGETLLPERYGPEEVAEAKLPGSRYFETQWQQKPLVEAGLIFKRGDLVPWIVLPSRFDASAIHGDLSFKGTPKEQLERINNGRSFVVLQHWAYAGTQAYLLDEIRGQWDFERAASNLKAFYEQCSKITPHVRVILEDKANGPATESRLRQLVPGITLWPEEGERSMGSKVERAEACQGYVEARSVHPPAHANWLKDWLDEVAGFPNMRWNDRVDAMTQSLLWRFGRGVDQVARYRKLTA
jgi:predicted phage terminase large subunit-like protein